MADDSTVEYINELYEVLDENDAPAIEQVYVVSNNDNDDNSDEQFEGDGNFPIILLAIKMWQRIFISNFLLLLQKFTWWKSKLKMEQTHR